MTYSEIVLPEQRIGYMLAACQTWRAIVANPTLTWDELLSVLNAGTVEEGEAAARIAYGVLQEQWDDPEFMDRPRAVIRLSDGWSSNRDTASTFFGQGGVTVSIEIPIPPSLKAGSEAYLDIRRKATAIDSDLENLPQGAPYIAFAQRAAEADGEADMKAYAGQTPFGVMTRTLFFDWSSV